MADTAKKDDHATTTVTVPRQFAAMLKTIATKRDMTMPEALEKYAGAAVAREYRRCVEEMSRDLGGEG